MIRVLMLDFGETLVHWETPFPNVPAALQALKLFRAASGVPLQLALVADCHMPSTGATPARIDEVFQEYLTLLDAAGLRTFFEPVSRHVTLSAHAGVLKPDPRVFSLALTRLGLLAAWDECLIISDDWEQLAACRKLGMSTLRFSGIPADETCFLDWSEAPLLVAFRVDPDNRDNLLLALGVFLAARHAMQLIAIEDVSADGLVRATARPLRRLDADAPAESDGVSENLPLPITVRLTSAGRVAEVGGELPAKAFGREAEWSTAKT